MKKIYKNLCILFELGFTKYVSTVYFCTGVKRITFVIMAEWKQLISEWLSEYAALQENEIKSFAAEHEHNHEIATAIFNLFYSEDEGEPSTASKIENDSEFEQVSMIYCKQCIPLL